MLNHRETEELQKETFKGQMYLTQGCRLPKTHFITKYSHQDKVD